MFDFFFITNSILVVNTHILRYLIPFFNSSTKIIHKMSRQRFQCQYYCKFFNIGKNPENWWKNVTFFSALNLYSLGFRALLTTQKLSFMKSNQIYISWTNSATQDLVMSIIRRQKNQYVNRMEEEWMVRSITRPPSRWRDNRSSASPDLLYASANKN